ncbi:hypothetical protein MN086_06320 [Sulfurovum sp. XGS-02]|uniref:hypothetical protein n=1 Tax=Sulfurovum sp. XGS-02 TaxID=2925411 RepID=UPI00204EB4AC|nr:hypothetical protein [Sulfurovum sp. XGS-02]UPT76667.1 hypothetical protein MN086_06320 [Sulfurovum sp. XGS-02]
MITLLISRKLNDDAEILEKHIKEIELFLKEHVKNDTLQMGNLLTNKFRNRISKIGYEVFSNTQHPKRRLSDSNKDMINKSDKVLIINYNRSKNMSELERYAKEQGVEVFILNLSGIIDNAFEKMIEGIEKTVSQNTRPQLYYEGSSIAEINSVYQFVKFFDMSFEKCEVYLEFPCDSGRVDAVVLVENSLILIEAKSNIDPKKFKVLNAQASRFEKDRVNYEDMNKESWLHKYYGDPSLLGYLEKFQLFIREKWSIEKDLEIYGVLLADTEKPLQLKRWGDQSYYDEIKLETIKPYTHKTKSNSVYDSWWHLMAYNHICTMN